MTPTSTTPLIPQLHLSCDQALRIAQEDAERVYRDLSPYRIEIAREVDGWHIDYMLRNTRLRGGGPHYVIDPQNGAILSKRYGQ